MGYSSDSHDMTPLLGGSLCGSDSLAPLNPMTLGFLETNGPSDSWLAGESA